MMILQDRFRALQAPARKQLGNLTAIMAELSDALKVQLSLSRDVSTSNQALLGVLEKAIENASGSHFAQVTQRLVDTSTQLHSHTEKVLETISLTTTSFTALVQSIEQFGDSFTEIKGQFNEMKSSAAEVSHIAFQSRLIALNAQVEAARLGNQGKAFDVVAQEIASLASRSEEISNEVEDDVTRMQAPLDKTAEQFEANRETLDSAQEAIKHLDESVSGIREQITSLGQASKEVESIAYKHVEMQDAIERIEKHANWIKESSTVLNQALESSNEHVNEIWIHSLPASKQQLVASLEGFENAVVHAIHGQSGAAMQHAIAEAFKRKLPPQQLLKRVSAAISKIHLQGSEVDLPIEVLLKNGEVVKIAVEQLEAKLSQNPPLEPKPHEMKIPTVIMGNAFEDYHDLGRRLVSMELKAAGFHVVDLGLSVHNDHFIEKARKHKADVIGVSSLLLHTAKWIPELRSQLNRAGLADVKVIAGGAPFLVDPGLCQEFGADGVGRSPGDAVRLVRYMANKSQRTH